MQRFSEFLKTEMEKNGVGPKKLEEILIEKGIHNVTYKRISDYTRSVITPSYEKAREITDALGSAITPEELRKMLELNREFVKQTREDGSLHSPTYTKEIVIHVKTRSILPNTSPVDAEIKLEERVNLIFGKCGPKEISLYAEQLIRKDLMENLKSELPQKKKSKGLPMELVNNQKKQSGGELLKQAIALKYLK